MLFVLFMLLLMKLGAAKHFLELDYDAMPPLYGLEDHGRCVRQLGGLYCVIQAEIYSREQNELLSFIKEFSKSKIKHYNHSLVERGVCVTKTCSKFIKSLNLNRADDLKSVLEECINESIENEYGINAKLSKIHSCSEHNETFAIDKLDLAFACVIFALLLINVIGSTSDVINNHDTSVKTKQYLESFSVFKNWDHLISETSDSKMEYLKGFYGIKSLMASLVIFGHIPLIVVAFSDNPQDFEKAFESEFHLKYNLTVLVQIYYFMTSFLLSFKLRIQEDEKRLVWKSIPQIIFLRFMRLTPVLAFTIGFSATWQRHLNTGPLWKLYVLRSADDCRYSWWWHLFYFTNYVLSDTKHCAPHLWYASSETQLYIFGVILLVIILNKNTKKQVWVLIMLIIIGSLFASVHVWLYDLEGNVVMGPEMLRDFENDTFFHSHIHGHINLPGFLMGLGTGLLVYHWQKNPIDYWKKYRIIRVVSWCSVPFLVCVIASGWFLHGTGGRPSLAARMIYAALNRVLFAVIFSVGIVSMVMKFESAFYRKILEWPFWRILSRLSYCTYLLHMNIVLILVGARSQLSHIDSFYTIVLFFGVWVTSYLVAMPVYLCLEAPLYTLAKKILMPPITKIKYK